MLLQELSVVRSTRSTWILALLLTLAAAAAAAWAGDDGPAREAAARFGRALVSSNPSQLDALLPERGKVRMRLPCFGFEDGSYSASQVQAMLQDFLRQGRVHSFDLLRVGGDAVHHALVQGRARATDRHGRTTEIELHLTLQPEGERWVLREIRESPR